MKPKLQTWLKCFTKMLVFTTAFVGLHTATVNAQQIEVTGQITSSEGDTLSGVTVRVQGTSRGTATDLDGIYSISVESDAVLEFSYVGYITQLVPVDRRERIDIILEEDVEALDELIVVGYGTIGKRVADAVLLQDDMKLIGTTANTYNYRIKHWPDKLFTN